MMSARATVARFVVLVAAFCVGCGGLAHAQRGRRADSGVNTGADAGPRDAGVPQPDAARTATRDGGALDPATLERARTLFIQGQEAYGQNRFDEASLRMVQAWELTHSPELAFNAARVFERMSDYANSVRYFEIFLRDAPNLPPDERTATEARIAAIREAQARRDQQVFTAPPSTDELTNEARTFFLRGVAMFRRGQYQAAQTAFVAAYQFAPLPEVVFNMAITAERLGARQDAIDYYREYIRARPDSPDRGDVEERIRRLRGH